MANMLESLTSDSLSSTDELVRSETSSGLSESGSESESSDLSLSGSANSGTLKEEGDDSDTVLVRRSTSSLTPRSGSKGAADEKHSLQDTKDEVDETPRPTPDPRFHEPPPSPYKRAALIVFTLVLFWIALNLRNTLWMEKKAAPKVIYASRYSKEHKFRPAASPIITETLKDGRIRIRGVGPTATPEPTPTSTPEKKIRKRKGGNGGNGGKGGKGGKGGTGGSGGKRAKRENGSKPGKAGKAGKPGKAGRPGN